ncbi:hypothetical protein WDZ17_12880 [Pseudokineococcus basanitobsidens]|uniref:Uncharacterized protein n=1 Tax=Pseudokineococcus basanitobsidens TaxID=1926649 RepID=A0ABU8RMG9_9ACTN
MTSHAPPAGLCAEAEDLWSDYLAERAEAREAPTARELTILRGAVRQLTTAERLEAELADLESVLVQGSRGNTRVTGLVAEVNKARAEVRLSMQSLKPASPPRRRLDLVPAPPAPATSLHERRSRRRVIPDVDD